MVGLAWGLFAPPVVGTRTEDGVADSGYALDRFFAAEGVFVLVAIGCGIASALLTTRWRRRDGWVVPVVVAGAALVASIVAWRVGVAIGPSLDAVRAAPVGTTVELPLEIRAMGTLLLWSIAATATALVIAIGDPSDPAPAPAPAPAANDHGT